MFTYFLNFMISIQNIYEERCVKFLILNYKIFTFSTTKRFSNSREFKEVFQILNKNNNLLDSCVTIYSLMVLKYMFNKSYVHVKV